MNLLAIRRRALMMNIKKFIRSIAGTPPLSLIKCFNEKSVINYRIDGNTIQDGTPIPEAPVDVESVGERTKNLFNKATAELNTGLAYTTGGTYSTNSYFTSDYIPIEKNQTYALNWNTAKWYCFYDADKNFLRYAQARSFNNTDAEYVRITAANEELDTLQLEKGSTTTEYEPYGYKVPVNVSGKNLFNLKQLTFSTDYQTVYELVTSNNSFTFKKLRPSGTANTKYNVFLKKGIYRISGNIYTSDGLGGGWAVYDRENKAYIVNNSSRGNCNGTFTITEDKEYAVNFYINYNSPKDTEVTYSNVQIELGDIATEYERYIQPTITNIFIDEPLRKVGNYVDYIDFENSKVVRNIKHIELTGDEDWKQYKDGGGKMTVIYPIGKIINDGEAINCYSNRLKGISRNRLYNYEVTGISASLSNIRVYYPPLTDTVESFVEFLKNNNMYVGYIMSTPKEEAIVLPHLPTFIGLTTIYDIDASLQPSNMEVTYYSKESA